MENFSGTELSTHPSCCSVRCYITGECVLEKYGSPEPSQLDGANKHATDHGSCPTTSSNVLTPFDKLLVGSHCGPTPREQGGGCLRRERSPEEMRAVAYHEAGHAVAAWRLPFGPNVTYVTVVPAGELLGHVTWQERAESAGHEDRCDLACAKLGGMAAESIFLGGVSPFRNINDLEDANLLALAATASMCPGILEGVPLGRLAATSGAIMESLILEAYSGTRELLKKHQDDVHKVAAALISCQILYSKDLRRLIGPPGPSNQGKITLPLGN